MVRPKKLEQELNASNKALKSTNTQGLQPLVSTTSFTNPSTLRYNLRYKI